jgi:hypothetical protein
MDAAFELQKLLTSSLPTSGIVTAIHAGGWASVATSAGLRQMRTDIRLAVGDAVTIAGDRVIGRRSAGPQQTYYV